MAINITRATQIAFHEDFINSVDFINPIEIYPVETVEVELRSLSSSSEFSVMAKNIWSKFSYGKNNAAELLETSIKNSTPVQCSNVEFWQANVAVGNHLSWEQWQPLLKMVAHALCRDEVDSQADMVFAGVFLNALKCTDEQRGVVLSIINEAKQSHAQNFQLEASKNILDKQSVILKRVNKTARQQMKSRFRG